MFDEIMTAIEPLLAWLAIIGWTIIIIIAFALESWQSGGWIEAFLHGSR